MPFSGNNNNNIANLRQYKLLRSVSNILEMSNLSRPIIDAAGLHYLLFFGVRNCSHTHTQTYAATAWVEVGNSPKKKSNFTLSLNNKYNEQ